ncbi:MAG: T9SS type A sorting domain-containing protein [Chlorobi bacterium]|nr:T9SS type A sorting domain-containing protein [Chlorobiota bacterium]
MVILFMIFSFAALQAGKENNIWYFGHGAGIDFNSGSPVALTDGAMYTNEGCSTVSDSLGNLLFYTDGVRVYTKTHVLMSNGTGLYGNSSSCQSAIIVPNPGNTGIYYIVTTDAHEHRNQDYGVNYSTVDMNMNNGLGSVIDKNKLLFKGGMEQLAAVKSGDQNSIWVLSRRISSNDFLVFSVDKNGFNTTPVISSVGTNVGDIKLGTVKISSDGATICTSVSMSFNATFPELYKFDNMTGKVSDPVNISDPGVSSAYGCEFSPDGSKLYISYFSAGILLDQYDLSSGNADVIKATKTTLRTSNTYGGGQLQLAPDGKIYLSVETKQHLSVINYPNLPGLACSFEYNKVSLNNKSSTLGLPSLISIPVLSTVVGIHCDFIFDDFKDIDELVLLGDSYKLDSTIRMTKSKSWRKSAVKYEDKISLDERFVCEFSFAFRDGVDPFGSEADPIGADGIALVFHNSEIDKVGKSGSGIGFESIPNCLAVEYDTYWNDSSQIDHKNDPDGNHLAVFCSGEKAVSNMHGSPSDLGTTSDIPLIYVDGRRYYSKIEHNPANKELVIYLDTTDNFQTPVLVIPDFEWNQLIRTSNGLAYIGLTSATGSVTEYHEIFDWSLCYPDRVIAGIEDIFSYNEITKEKYHTVAPNPVKDQTYFKYEVEEAAQVTIEVIDISGKTVAIPVNQFQSAGTYSIPWQPGNLNKGAYYYQLKIGPENYQGRLIIGE